MSPQRASKTLLPLAIIFLLLPAVVPVYGQAETRREELLRLLDDLKNGDVQRQRDAEFTFASRGRDLTAPLIELYKTSNDQNVIDGVNEAFRIIGKDSVPALVDTLEAEVAKTPRDAVVARRTLNILAIIAESSWDDLPALDETVPLLVGMLEADKRKNIEAVEIFKTKKGISADEIAAVNDSLQDFDAAAHCLGRIGRRAKDAVPLLIEIMRNERYRVGAYEKVESVDFIIRDLIRNEDFSANQRIVAAFERYRDELSEKDRRRLSDRINRLTAAEASQKRPLRDLLAKYPSAAGAAAFVLLLTLGWLSVFAVRPLWLLKAYEAFPSGEARLSGAWGTLTAPARLLAAFVYRPRVLDAWVRKHLPTARASFLDKPVVKDRRIYVPVGLFLDGEYVPELTPRHLRATFARNQTRILISGVGGAGKTSLAFHVADWGMSKDPYARLCPGHQMIPVVLEHDFAEGGEDALMKAVRAKLCEAIDVDAPISNALLRALLKKKRVLVLIDGLSEMNEETNRAILSGLSAIPANAVLFTSRGDEALSGLSRTHIRPTKIKGNQLSSFVERYLTSLGRKELFEDEDFFEGCRLLSTIVNDRDITALLARLFVEQMVAKQEKAIEEELPENIPQLMLQSIKVLHKKTPSDSLALRDVIKAAKVLAWECLKQDYRPLPVDYEAARESLAGLPNGERSLSYLRDKLRLIEAASFDAKIRFKIDPLAEYLAGVYLVEENRGDEIKWLRFFNTLLLKAGSPEIIKGFLLALRDCCMAENGSNGVPVFVAEELTEMTAVFRESP